MDFKTAREFVISQVDTSDQATNSFLSHLSQGKSPIPGQVTNLLLSLKVIFDGLRGTTHLDRELVYALHLLSSDSRASYLHWKQNKVDWPPLLQEDLERIANNVKSIMADRWLP
jgi:hypothetical protein